MHHWKCSIAYLSLTDWHCRKLHVHNSKCWCSGRHIHAAKTALAVVTIHARLSHKLLFALQLASFMSELESSGLLERDSAQNSDQDTLPHGTNTVQADSGISTSSKPQTASEAQPSLAAAIADAVNDDTAEVPKQQDLSSLPEQEAASLANADASPSEPAEQRVLGDLEGAPTWREVLLPSMLSKFQDSSRILIMLVLMLCLCPVGLHSKA